jgi:hypothetical protein
LPGTVESPSLLASACPRERDLQKMLTRLKILTALFPPLGEDHDGGRELRIAAASNQ